MSVSKYVLGGAFVVVALVALVPLFKKDFQNNTKIPAILNVDASKNMNSASNTVGTIGDIIGTYNGIVVKKSDLSAQENQALFKAETQMYKAEEGILAQRYIETLIDQYAKDKKITDKNLAQKQFMEEKLKLSDEKVKEFLNRNKDNPQLKGKSIKEQTDLVKPYLMQQEASEYFTDLVEKAKLKGTIRVSGIQQPQSPRIKLELGDSPSKGPVNAPITLVEFADYQCPYCSTAEETVNKILKKYKNKVRFVFKSFPLVQLHPQAVNSSIAAECAQAQNKFWEMHDVLFQNQRKLADNVYDDFAKTIGLDIKKFQACFKNPQMQLKVMNDENYGQSLGINATPAFYVNGILLMGAQPESEFTRLIDNELAHNSL